MESKKCTSCRRVKPLTAFHQGGDKWGKHTMCVMCRKLAREGLAPHQIEVVSEEVKV